MRLHLKSILLATGLSLTGLTQAANIEVEFDIPQMAGGKYARPYVAIWAENGRDAKHLLVWHEQKKEDKWLSDLRRWWRKVGRYDAHVDGLTGATKGPGHYSQSFSVGDWQNFKLYIEAARENGGRTLLKTDIDATRTEPYQIPAEGELGDIIISVKP